MLGVKLSLSTISSQLWKNMQTLFIYRVSKKKLIPLKCKLVALYSYNLTDPLGNPISTKHIKTYQICAILIDLKHKSNCCGSYNHSNPTRIVKNCIE